MNKNRYIDVCNTILTDKSAQVRNTISGEVGRVEGCTREHLLVRGQNGEKFCWDYHKCEQVDRP